MAHLDLDHSDMKPGALIRYEIAQDAGRAKQLLVASVIASMMIVVLASMFLTAVH
ncbi:MAG: hypothetical protein ABIQ30_16230 [Devosia sp.]